MTEKDMKKLTRYQLLELLIIQSEQVKELQRQVEEMQKKLDAKEIQMTVVGSIAEASMQLSGIFEAAQKTADMYLDAVRIKSEQLEAEAIAKGEEILLDAQKRAAQLLNHAEQWPENEADL